VDFAPKKGLVQIYMSGNAGGFNRSMQHSTRIHKALKTNAKVARLG